MGTWMGLKDNSVGTGGSWQKAETELWIETYYICSCDSGNETWSQPGKSVGMELEVTGMVLNLEKELEWIWKVSGMELNKLKPSITQPRR